MPGPSTTEQVAAVVDAHVREIIGAAERAALNLERELEEASAARAAEVRRQAERDAAGVRAAAEDAARARAEESRRHCASWAAERIARMQALSDELVAGGEAIRVRLAGAEELQRGLQELVAALASAASATAAEAGRPADELPPT